MNKRELHKEKIIELLKEFGPMEIADISTKINCGTKYIRKLVEESDNLHFTLEPKLVREWIVWYDEE
jgi:hypothetical protein